jgi:hypothetical protein
MKSQTIHLVAFYYAKPRAGVRTTQKGWMNDPNNIQYDERVEVTRGLKSDTYAAKIILDITNQKVVKNTWSDVTDFAEIYGYYARNYADYLNNALQAIHGHA